MNDYYKTCKFAKPRLVKHKRATVSETTYRTVYEACKGKCVLMDKHCKGKVELHHVFGRGRYLTDNPYGCLMLCDYHHDITTHGNLKKYRPILANKLREIYGVDIYAGKRGTDSISDLRKTIENITKELY